MGDIVNLAARLMVAAGKLNSGLLCDETTYEGAQAKLSFRRLDPIMVKGKSEPIPIFVPQNKDEAELALEAVLADLEAGSGGVAVEVRQRLLCCAVLCSRPRATHCSDTCCRPRSHARSLAVRRS